jgi:hypothetical protein
VTSNAARPPISLQVGSAFDLLQVEHTGFFFVDELLKLHLPGQDSVHIPRGDLHQVTEYIGPRRTGPLDRSRSALRRSKIAFDLR